MKAFISYSHRDTDVLDRLHTHLAMLRREGLITEWFDREILAGGDVDDEISGQLESCDLFLALVSPDFIASDYCYEKEMKRALERHDAGECRVIPIIAEPCDWKATPLQGLKAIPKDAKPIVEWTNENSAYLDIVMELRRVASIGRTNEPSTQEENEVQKVSAGRRYRVKRDFDEIDRTDFRKDAFGKIREYFESASAEIDGIESLRARFEDLGPQSFGCTVINRTKELGTAHITVHAGNDRFALGDIYFSFNERAHQNSANGGFRIECDDYDLFLVPEMFIDTEEKRVSAEGAAEILWSKFLEQAGVTYG
ncbi:hypothetical protein BMS3Bbin10_02976 [bacterium BMS3Bbin10]|nr:hypothetical protein BMS3Bbin10_02976 [bacterium BMS3Bbin10]